jgi:hypothetical protein
MKLMDRFERVLKDLDALTRYAREGLNAHETLDAKLVAIKVQNLLSDTRRALRLQYFKVEDTFSSLHTCSDCEKLSCDCKCEE